MYALFARHEKKKKESVLCNIKTQESLLNNNERQDGIIWLCLCANCAIHFVLVTAAVKAHRIASDMLLQEQMDRLTLATTVPVKGKQCRRDDRVLKLICPSTDIDRNLKPCLSGSDVSF